MNNQSPTVLQAMREFALSFGPDGGPHACGTIVADALENGVRLSDDQILQRLRSGHYARRAAQMRTELAARVPAGQQVSAASSLAAIRIALRARPWACTRLNPWCEAVFTTLADAARLIEVSFELLDGCLADILLPLLERHQTAAWPTTGFREEMLALEALTDDLSSRIWTTELLPVDEAESKPGNRYAREPIVDLVEALLARQIDACRIEEAALAMNDAMSGRARAVKAIAESLAAGDDAVLVLELLSLTTESLRDLRAELAEPALAVNTHLRWQGA